MRTKTNALLVIFLFALMAVVACQSTEKQEKSAGNTEQSVNLTPQERLAEIKAELKIVKAELTQEGKYDCCTHPPCDWCALQEGDCECDDNLKAGKAVCPECGLGWHNGQGVVEGIEASQVKWDITHEHGESGHKD